MAKMGTFDLAVFLTILQLMWTSSAQGYTVSPPDPMITAAPEYNFHLEIRQDNSATCTEWLFPSGYQRLCPVDSTCLFTSLGNSLYEACGPLSANEFFVYTDCTDYYSWTAMVDPSVLYCPYTASYCAINFYLSSDVSWTEWGCATISGYADTATWDVAVSPTPTMSSFESASAAASTTATTMTPVVTSPTMAVFSTQSTSALSTSTISVLPTQSAQPVSGGSSSSQSSSNAATIGGAVGGAVGGLALIIGGILIWYFMRKKRNQRTPQQPFVSPEKMYDESMKSPMQSPPLGKSYC
ncbi:hypothetical protein MMC18_008163 [Xylographa bjoerkii]|nr:hypothetical protein [Xylographa bjoerkii]